MINYCAKKDVSSIVKELQSIADELNSISDGVRKDFTGIGNEICAASLKDTAREYESLAKQLKYMP